MVNDVYVLIRLLLSKLKCMDADKGITVGELYVLLDKIRYKLLLDNDYEEE